MELRFFTVYERGYNAGVDERPREAPDDVEQSYPDTRPEWYKGYDDAIGDSPDEQQRVQATFKGNFGNAY